MLSNRLPRQTSDPTEQRLVEKPPQICCRCIDQVATCNNAIATGGNENTKKTVGPGLTCPDLIVCEVFDCDSDIKQVGCKIQNTRVVDQDLFLDNVVDFKQGDQEKCPAGQKVCCNPGPGGGFEKRLGLVGADNPLGIQRVDTNVICDDSKLSAVQDFGHGITCGKRDSRYGLFANFD